MKGPFDLHLLNITQARPCWTHVFVFCRILQDFREKMSSLWWAWAKQLWAWDSHDEVGIMTSVMLYWHLQRKRPSVWPTKLCNTEQKKFPLSRTAEPKENNLQISQGLYCMWNWWKLHIEKSKPWMKNSLFSFNPAALQWKEVLSEDDRRNRMRNAKY